MPLDQQLITVDKVALIAKLKENRDGHAGKVAKAREVYRERVIEELGRRLEEAQTGRDIDPGFLHRLPIPRDYTVEYDRAIDQYEWEKSDVVELTTTNFNRFVRDEWDWHDAFVGSTQTYLAS